MGRLAGFSYGEVARGLRQGGLAEGMLRALLRQANVSTTAFLDA